MAIWQNLHWAIAVRPSAAAKPAISAHTRRCSSGSRTMPFLASARVSSNWGLISATMSAGRAASRVAAGRTSFNEMKLTSMVTTSGGSGNACGIERANIRCVPDRDDFLRARAAADEAGRCRHRRHRRRRAPAPEQHRRRSCRCSRADIEADARGDIDAEAVEGAAASWTAAARHPGEGGLRAQRRVDLAISSTMRLAHRRCVSAVTRPAAIAACALARLSNRPRSTSRRSARRRGGIGVVRRSP